MQQNHNVNATDWQKICLLFSTTCQGDYAPKPNEFAGNQSRDNPPVQACALKSRGRFDDEGSQGKTQAILKSFSSWKEGRVKKLNSNYSAI